MVSARKNEQSNGEVIRTKPPNMGIGAPKNVGFGSLASRGLSDQHTTLLTQLGGNNNFTFIPDMRQL